MDNPTFPIALAALKSAKTANERIDALPLPMVFKGTLGTGGTISTLPTASSENEGFVYIVITDGTYAGQTASAGDMFISDGASWVLVPSADEPSVIDDSVTSTALTWSSSKIYNDLAIKSFTYRGTNTAVAEITFPDTPIFILTIVANTAGDTHYALPPIPWGLPKAWGMVSYNQTNYPNNIQRYNFAVDFSDNKLTITGSAANTALNGDRVYTVYYI